jgi:colicin import membrane protein
MNSEISTFSTDDSLLKKMIILSIGVHLGLMLFFGLKAALFPKETFALDSAIRVDMVALPDKLSQLPEKPQPATPVAPPPKPEVKPIARVQPPPVAKPVVLKPTSKAKTLEKIKKLEREEREKKILDNIKQEVAQEEAKNVRQAKLKQLLIGNAVSPGTALHGLDKSDFNEYLGELHTHVQQHWNLPEWLQNDTLKATVIVYIDFRGVVVKRILEKSSGDSRFDSYALKAVDEASPFPQPPPKFVDVVKVDGIVLGFPQ